MILAMNEAMWCLKSAGFSGDDLVIGGAIGMAESGLDTDRIGRLAGADQVLDNEDLGWMQISTKWHEAKIIDLTGQNWRDPIYNAVLARQVFNEFASRPGGGWTAWAAYNSKDYEKYLPMARNAESGLWAPGPPGEFMVWNRRLST